MNDLIILLAALFALAALVCSWLLLRRGAADFTPLRSELERLAQADAALLQTLRDEALRERAAAADEAGRLRGELAAAAATQQTALLDRLDRGGHQQLESLRRMSEQLVGFGTQAHDQSRAMRDEIARSLKSVGDATSGQLNAAHGQQQRALADFAANLNQAGEKAEQAASLLRKEVGESVTALARVMNDRADAAAQSQERAMAGFSDHLGGLTRTIDGRMKDVADTLSASMNTLREQSAKAAGDSRSEINQTLLRFQEHLGATATQLQQQLQAIATSTEERLEATRTAVDRRLDELRKGNEEKLEQMRRTVDEQLQGTLERRLGESFKLVSDRLEQVHAGLGDMRTLASGVGDLKRVLTNVKNRGTWGECQLGALLEQIFTADQYAANISTVPGSRERVEFAIRLPGRGEHDDTPIWLPIDAKCPIEDYQRLLDAEAANDLEGVRDSAKALESSIRASARSIADKYVSPPHTTDFAILFVPTEGLFSQVMRTPGLCESLQREHRVMVAGPTTLSALLTSLQVGFRTLAIQKRTSEVWTVLSAVKTEFAKFGGVLDKVKKQLSTASNTIDEASRRTRAMERKLRDVEELPADHAHPVQLAIASIESDIIDADDRIDDEVDDLASRN